MWLNCVSRRSSGLVLGMAAILLVAFPLAAVAQTVSGTITGAITDSSGLAIVGANVTVTSDQTGAVRTATTNETGSFTITALPPGGYALKVESKGFSALQRTGLTLSANERLSAGQIELRVGALTETITVAAQGAVVQTTTGEQSVLLTTDRMATMMVRGRDVVSLLKILPGVSWQADQEANGGTQGTGPKTTATAGAPANFSQLNLDGLLSNDLGTPNVFSSSVSMDAIDEVKVLLNAYQA